MYKPSSACIYLHSPCHRKGKMFFIILIIFGVLCITMFVNCGTNIGMFSLFVKPNTKTSNIQQNVILNNITAVENECVDKKHDEIMGEKFNSTIQISCKGSGVYDKYQLGHKVECCGGKEF